MVQNFNPTTATPRDITNDDPEQLAVPVIKKDNPLGQKETVSTFTSFVAKALAGLGISNVQGLNTALQSLQDSINNGIGDVLDTIAGLTKANVGLSEVDNTADLDKPISTATQNALDGKQDQDNVLDELVAAYPNGAINQVPRKTALGFEFYTPSSGGGIGLSDLSASDPILYDDGTGSFSFDSSGFATSSQGALASTALQPSAIGNTILAYNANLAGIAGLTPTDGRFLKGTGSGYTIAALTPTDIPDLDAGKITTGIFGDSQIPVTIARDSEVTSAIAALSSVYQPLDSDLSDIAALTTVAFGRSLLTQANAAEARTTLKAVGSDTTGITGASAITNTVLISQSNYDDLPTKDPNTAYYIPE